MIHLGHQSFSRFHFHEGIGYRRDNINPARARSSEGRVVRPRCGRRLSGGAASFPHHALELQEPTIFLLDSQAGQPTSTSSFRCKDFPGKFGGRGGGQRGGVEL